MNNDQWTLNNERWTMNNEQWIMSNEQLKKYIDQWFIKNK